MNYLETHYILHSGSHMSYANPKEYDMFVKTKHLDRAYLLTSIFHISEYGLYKIYCGRIRHYK